MIGAYFHEHSTSLENAVHTMHTKAPEMKQMMLAVVLYVGEGAVVPQWLKHRLLSESGQSASTSVAWDKKMPGKCVSM